MTEKTETLKPASTARPALRSYEFIIGQLVKPIHRKVSWDKVSNDVRVALKSCVFSLFTDSPRGALLLGPVGSGKTSCLSLVVMDYVARYLKRIPDEDDDWIADSVLDRSRFQGVISRLRIVTHAELIRMLRAYRTDNEFDTGFPSRLLCDILIIDDLGRGYDDQHGWNVSLQDEYFDWRWSNRKATFISTNKSSEPGAGDYIRYWKGWERIVDRLLDPEYMEVLVLNEKSWRRKR